MATASERIRAAREARDAAERTQLHELRVWLRTSSAAGVLDDAVLGCLTTSDACELAADYGVTLVVLRSEISAALAEGC